MQNLELLWLRWLLKALSFSSCLCIYASLMLILNICVHDYLTNIL